MWRRGRRHGILLSIEIREVGMADTVTLELFSDYV